MNLDKYYISNAKKYTKNRIQLEEINIIEKSIFD